MDQRAQFLDLIQRNPINVSILDPEPKLAVPRPGLVRGRPRP
jgi:hypothetical protein